MTSINVTFIQKGDSIEYGVYSVTSSDATDEERKAAQDCAMAISRFFKIRDKQGADAKEIDK